MAWLLRNPVVRNALVLTATAGAAVVSVTDRTGEARYPSFKAIMASKKKPITTWTLADLGIDSTRVGTAGAATAVRSAAGGRVLSRIEMTDPRWPAPTAGSRCSRL